MNLYKVQLLSICFIFISSLTYGASFPTESYSYESQETIDMTKEQNNLLGTAYVYNPYLPANQVNLNGGSAPDPIQTNNGAAFAVGDSLYFDPDGFDGDDWYVLDWSTTWGGYLGITSTGGSLLGGYDAAFLGPEVPIKDEWYLLLILASCYGIFIYRKNKKKLTI